MKKKVGLGQRLIERIKAIKAGIYIDENAKFGIKVIEFALDHRYPSGHVYKWIGDVVVPDYEAMLRLAKDLDVAPGWLHYGDVPAVAIPDRRRSKRRKPVPIRGGSAGENVLPVDGASGLQVKPTVCRVSPCCGETLRKVRGSTMARRLLYLVPTMAYGTHRRAA